MPDAHKGLYDPVSWGRGISNSSGGSPPSDLETDPSRQPGATPRTGSEHTTVANLFLDNHGSGEMLPAAASRGTFDDFDADVEEDPMMSFQPGDSCWVKNKIGMSL